MQKVKIKRVQKNKKKISTKEKVLAGLGVGTTILGGAAAVNAPKANKTQIVSTKKATDSKTGSKVSKILNDVFGTPQAKAFDENGNPQEGDTKTGDDGFSYVFYQGSWVLANGQTKTDNGISYGSEGGQWILLDGQTKTGDDGFSYGSLSGNWVLLDGQTKQENNHAYHSSGGAWVDDGEIALPSASQATNTGPTINSVNNVAFPPVDRTTTPAPVDNRSSILDSGTNTETTAPTSGSTTTTTPTTATVAPGSNAINVGPVDDGNFGASTQGPTLSGAPILNASGTGIDVSNLSSSGGNDRISIDDSQVNYSVPGTYTVTINAYDANGNLTTQTYSITIPAQRQVSGTLPGPSEVKGEDNGPSTTTASVPVLTGTIALNSSGTGIDVSNLHSSGGDERISVDDSKVDYTTPGTYTVTVNAYDSNGNVTSQEYTVTIPGSGVSSGAGNGSAGTSTGSTQGAASLSGAPTLNANGNGISLGTLKFTDSNGNDLSDNISIDDSQVLYGTPGTYNVTINAYDSSGNLVSQTYAVTIPATAGSGASAAGSGSANTTATATGPTLTGVPTLNASGTGISIESLFSTGGNQNISIDDSQVIYGVPGTYPVTINAYDSSGNVTSKTYNITIPGTTGVLTADNASQTTYSSDLDPQILAIHDQLASQISSGQVQFFNADSVTAFMLGLGGDHKSGDTTTVNGKTYTFDGSAWYLQSSPASSSTVTSGSTPSTLSRIDTSNNRSVHQISTDGGKTWKDAPQEGDFDIQNGKQVGYHNGQWTPWITPFTQQSSQPLLDAKITSTGNNASGAPTYSIDIKGPDGSVVANFTGTLDQINQKIEDQYGTRYGSDQQIYASGMAALNSIKSNPTGTGTPGNGALYTGNGVAEGNQSSIPALSDFLDQYFKANPPAGMTADQVAWLKQYILAGQSGNSSMQGYMLSPDQGKAINAAMGAYNDYVRALPADQQYMIAYNNWLYGGQKGTAPTPPAGFASRHNADGSLKIGPTSTSTAPTISYTGSQTPKVGDGWQITITGTPGQPVYSQVGGSVSLMGYIDGHGVLILNGVFTADMLNGGGTAKPGTWLENWYVGTDPRTLSSADQAKKTIGQVSFTLSPVTVQNATIPATVSGGYTSTISQNSDGTFTVKVSDGTTITVNSLTELKTQAEKYNTTNPNDQKVLAALAAAVDKLQNDAAGNLAGQGTLTASGSNSYTYKDPYGSMVLTASGTSISVTFGNTTLIRDSQGNYKSADGKITYHLDASGNLLDANNIMVQSAGNMTRVQAAVNTLQNGGTTLEVGPDGVYRTVSRTGLVLGGGSALSIINLNGNTMLGAGETPLITVHAGKDKANAPVYATGGMTGTSGGTTFLGYTDANGDLTVITNPFGTNQVGNWQISVFIGSSGAKESAAPLAIVQTDTSKMAQLGTTANFTVSSTSTKPVVSFMDQSLLYATAQDGTKVNLGPQSFATQQTAEFLAQKYGGTAKLVKSGFSNFALTTISPTAQWNWVIEFPDGSAINAGALAKVFSGSLTPEAAEQQAQQAIQEAKNLHTSAATAAQVQTVAGGGILGTEATVGTNVGGNTMINITGNTSLSTATSGTNGSINNASTVVSATSTVASGYTVNNAAVRMTFVNDTTGNTQTLRVGDHYTITITGPAGAYVYTWTDGVANGQPTRYQIPQNGTLVISGSIQSGDIGIWHEHWSVNTQDNFSTSTPIGNLNFTVVAAGAQVTSGTTTGTQNSGATQNTNQTANIGTLSFTNTNGSSTFKVGDTWKLQITGAAANTDVFAVGGEKSNGQYPSDKIKIGTTDFQGNLTLTKQLETSDIGDWQITIMVGNNTLGNPLQFSVLPVGSVTTSTAANTTTTVTAASYNAGNGTVVGGYNPAYVGYWNPGQVAGSSTVQGLQMPSGYAASNGSIDLSFRYANVNGTIYDKSTGVAFATPQEFFNASGVSSFNGVIFDTAWQPGRQVQDVSMAARTYVVKKGDTLWGIAKQQYGDGKQWRKIMAANAAKIKSPRTLQVGTTLIIP